MQIPKHLQSIFWDTDPQTLNPRQHRQFIISRVAEKGAWADILWLKKHFGLSAIRTAVAKSRNTTAKTKNFWRLT